MAATPAWLATVEALLNRGLGGSARASALARRLESTTLRVVIEGVTTISASVIGGRIALLAAGDHADASITGTPMALLQLAGRGGNGGVAGQRKPAQIEGDAEVANLYRQLFAMARPDPEEELARVVGDVAAHRLSRLAGKAMAWARSTRRTAGENVAEYLQEESRDLVNKPELNDFLGGVDALRESADRVEARIARLEQRLKG